MFSILNSVIISLLHTHKKLAYVFLFIRKAILFFFDTVIESKVGKKKAIYEAFSFVTNLSSK